MEVYLTIKQNAMVSSYVKIAFRNFTKRKLFSVINVSGLSIGFSVCIVLLIYVESELSYDRHNEKADQIYQTVSTYYINGELRGTYPLSDFGQGPALISNIGEIKNFVRTHLMHGGAVISNKSNPSNSVQFYEDESIQFVDSSFFDVFTHKSIQGDLQTALDQPNSIVLTQKAAQKYFNEEQIIGKVLNVSGSWWTNGDYVVTAVIENPPANSHFKFDFLVGTHNLLQNEFYRSSSGTSTEGNFVTYVEIDTKAEIKSVLEKIPASIEKYQGEELKRIDAKVSLLLQPLTEIHLTPGYNLEMSPTTSVDTLYFFILVSGLIILLAWINYINLCTARATARMKEVGIKKTIGAARHQLISQFMMESFLTHLVSSILAICIVYFILPSIGDLLGKDFTLEYTNPRLWIVVLSFVCFGSLIAGAYPAFILSSFKPITALKGIEQRASGAFSLRQALVVVQFAVSLIMIAGSFVITRQLAFMQNHNKGYDSGHMLIIKGPGVMNEPEIESRLSTIKSQLKNLSFVGSVTTSDAVPGGGYNLGTGMRKNGFSVEDNKSGDVVFVDPDFVNSYEMRLLAGDVLAIEKQDQKRSVLINEAALRIFRFKDAESAVGDKLIVGGDSFVIKGVLKDYHWSSLKSTIVPTVLALNSVCGKYLSVKVQGGNLNESINQIRKLYSDTFPEKPFEYFFLDDFFNYQYKSDRQFHRIVSLFSLLSIVIACLGLVGLTSFTVGRKAREISIRKVFGASIQSILILLSGGFLKPILIASAIAVPIILYGTDPWLHIFAYKIDQSMDLYLLPIIVLMVISILTIVATTIKAASVNPVGNLKGD